MLRACRPATWVALATAVASCVGGAQEPYGGEVWLAPNLASADYLRMFTEPDAWTGARGEIGVFKFYQANLIHDDDPALGGNGRAAFVEVDAFRKLRQWGLRTAIEVGILKPYGCKGAETAQLTLLAIENVEAAGGAVDDLAVDEALYGGSAYCQLGLEASADEVARFVETVHAQRPAVRIGIIEPYPSFSVSTLEAWIGALRARGFSPGFVQLDVDRSAVARSGLPVGRDVEQLHRACRRAGIPFGVILWSGYSPISTDALYYDRVMDWAHQLRNVPDALPEQLVFQSWVQHAGDGALTVPANLPDAEGTPSHTRLLRDVLHLYGRAAAIP